MRVLPTMAAPDEDKPMKLARRFTLAAALFAWTLAGWAQDFPSKPVRIEARGDGPRLIVEGPAPMLTESGQPNGQSGSWRLDLRRSEQPGEPLSWSGTAVHTGAELAPDGVSVDMERNFRRWQ